MVTATFFNFHPDRAGRALPDAWALAAPADVWATRRSRRPPALRRMDPDGGRHGSAPGAAACGRLLDGVPDAGRPLFAATRATGEPDDPVEALWYWCTCLREHRGDGHVAALTAAGLDGCEALVLFAASERSAGRPAPAVAGLVGGRVGLRPRPAGPARPAGRRRASHRPGRELRRWIEATTDDLAGMVTGRRSAEPERTTCSTRPGVGGGGRATRPGVITYPNPMGLPGPAGG